MIRAFILSCMLLTLASPVRAHPLSPYALTLTEQGDDRVLIELKRVVSGSRALEVVLPSNCQSTGPTERVEQDDSIVERTRTRCRGGLGGQPLRAVGLAAAGIGVVVQFKPASGALVHQVLSAAQPSIRLPVAQTTWSIAQTYLALGTEHLLSGYDHLLFVCGMALLAASFRRAALAITAFSLGHSITLGCAALGLVALPQRAVEVGIALSLAVLAARIVDGRGSSHAMPSVAGAFGLLHGLGFANALAATGLPRQATVLALASFNLGVELGQLLVLGLVFPLCWLSHSLEAQHARRVRVGLGFAIGSLAAMWTLERIWL